MSSRASRSLMFTPPPTVPLPPLAWSVAPRPLRLPSMLAWAAPHASSGSPGGTSGTLRVVHVRGDGRCLYRSIARGLAAAEGRTLSERFEREDADALRDIAFKSMCVDRKKEFEARHIVEGSLSAYCSQMRSTSFFAGEAEMLAISDALKIPIGVYIKDQRGSLRNIMTYGEQYKAVRKDMVVRVAFNGYNHYDSVILR
jgi:hypothetical protein